MRSFRAWGARRRGRRTRTTVWVAGGACFSLFALAVLTAPVASSYSKKDSHGGDVIDGLQVVLEADKQEWEPGETPQFRADLLVVGPGSLGIDDPPMGVVIEYDGIQYTLRAAGMLSAPNLFGRGLYGLRGSLNRELIDAKRQPLTLTSGKHTIRLAFNARPPRGGTTGKPVLVFSNPVVITIRDVAQTSTVPTAAVSNPDKPATENRREGGP